MTEKMNPMVRVSLIAYRELEECKLAMSKAEARLNRAEQIMEKNHNVSRDELNGYYEQTQLIVAEFAARRAKGLL